jgi:hypothetical protein
MRLCRYDDHVMSFGPLGAEADMEEMLEESPLRARNHVVWLSRAASPKQTCDRERLMTALGGSGLSGFGWTVEKPDIEAAAGRGGI